MKLYFFALCALVLQGCAAYPDVAWNRADYKRCDLTTREFEFKVTENAINGKTRFHSADELISYLVVSGFVFSASAVISGSIVIVGNTIHFLEKQGRCDDSALNETIDAFIEPFLEEGGELIDETKSMSDSTVSNSENK